MKRRSPQILLLALTTLAQGALVASLLAAVPASAPTEQTPAYCGCVLSYTDWNGIVCGLSSYNCSDGVHKSCWYSCAPPRDE